MHFAVLIPTLAVASTVSAASFRHQKRAVTAQQLADAIADLTTQSQDLQATSAAIPATLAADNPYPYQATVAGYQTLLTTMTGDITSMDGTAPFTDAEAQPICDAFAAFAPAQKGVLDSLTEKSGLDSVDKPIVNVVLTSFESVMDTFAIVVGDSTALCAADITSQQATLDKSLTAAICAYKSSYITDVNDLC